MHGGMDGPGGAKPAALSLLASERPRNVGWLQAAGLLFGDWGTSRLYVLGLAFLFAGRTSFWLITLMSVLIVAVGWAYTQICRIYPDGGGVYTAAKSRSRTLAVIGALLLFADYTVTASLSSLDAFHYFGLPRTTSAEVQQAKRAARGGKVNVKDAGSDIVLEHDRHDVPLAALPEAVTFQSLPPALRARVHYDAARHALVFDGAMTRSQRDALAGLSSNPAWASAVATLYGEARPAPGESLLAWDSPGLWAILAVAVFALFNLMGPKHTGAFAIAAAVGMVAITLLIACGSLPQVPWGNLHNQIGRLTGHNPWHLWEAFVSIVLALSGVEAIANLTGVMRRPVVRTSRRAIWIVTAEVAIFNVLLCVVMVGIPRLQREAHVADMLAFLSSHYIGDWAEWAVRILGGILLLSATNTALTDMISVQYLMARDGELPHFLVKLNRFGVPWVPVMIAGSAPIVVLLVSHDLESLAALYAIGVIGAVAINVSLCALHPRLRRLRRKGPMLLLAAVLLAIWITLAYVKRDALIFVTVVMAVGLTIRQLTRLVQRRHPAPSLLRQAILEQLPADIGTMPKMLVGTYGSEALAPAALAEVQRIGGALVVCFIRQVALSYKYEGQPKLTLDTDQAAQKAFARFLELGHAAGVPVMPVYDTGADAAELMAENAAIYGCRRVLIGTSRQGALFHLIKGHFQRHLEALLPPDIPVEVVQEAA